MSKRIDSESEISSVKAPEAPKSLSKWLKISIIAIVSVVSVVTFAVILFFVIRASSSASPSSPLASSTASPSAHRPSPLISPRPSPLISPRLSPLPSPSPPSAPFSRNKTARELVFVQILFRHGARASNRKMSAETMKLFPRGRGQLTDRGFKNSHLLGKFLKARYVDTGFLNSRMAPREMYWKSRNNHRCLSTASTVGAAMFQSEQTKFPHIGVVSDSHDSLLSGSSYCPRLNEIRDNLCSAIKDRKTTKKTRHEASYECITNGSVPPIFQNMSIEDSDIYISLFENDALKPGSHLDNIELIISEYMKVRHFYSGLGAYKNPEMVKLRFGNLVDLLLENLETVWRKHIKNKTKVKFLAFSTQDWLLAGLLESFGVFDEVLKRKPSREPGYNSMIVMELWKQGGQPFVKFYFKPEEITSVNHKMIDFTNVIPNCGSATCHLSNFTNCCNDYRLSEEQFTKACVVKN